jgi:hypothetical protein
VIIHCAPCSANKLVNSAERNSGGIFSPNLVPRRRKSHELVFALHTLGNAGTQFEFECCDTALLYNLAHFLDRVLVKTPLP